MGQVLLVRHGQASFGTDDYDVLSGLGEEQAALVGQALSELKPAVVVHGALRRQRETARIAAEAAGWDAPLVEDHRWDEFEMTGFQRQNAAVRATTEVPPADAGAGAPADRAREFQRWFEAATDRWLAGEHEPGDESWVDFGTRTSAALQDAAEHGTAVVFTSGGPVAALTAALVDGGAAAYRRLMPVMVNTSVTKVVSGRRGLSLLAFNAHDHLPRELVTYR